MDEYISRRALMCHIESEARRWGFDYDYWQVLADVEDFPPADVRPVVTCGDCRWFNDMGYSNLDPEMPELRMGSCRILGRDVQACWFCGTGGKKGDDAL